MNSHPLKSKNLALIHSGTFSEQRILVALFVLACWGAGLFTPLRANAATLVYSTYLGSGDYDGAYAVTVDKTGNAYVAGATKSTNGFPLLNSFQASTAAVFRTLLLQSLILRAACSSSPILAA